MDQCTFAFQLGLLQAALPARGSETIPLSSVLMEGAVGEGKRPPGSTPSPELQRVEVLGEGDLGNSRVRREWTLATLLKARGSEGLGPSAGLTLAFVIQVPVSDCLPFCLHCHLFLLVSISVTL